MCRFPKDVQMITGQPVRLHATHQPRIVLGGPYSDFRNSIYCLPVNEIDWYLKDPAHHIAWDYMNAYMPRWSS